MALSIGIKVGSRIDAGGDIVEVKAMPAPNRIVVMANGREFVITDEASTEILPGVKVFAGIGPISGNTHRLAFVADRSIPIHRLGKQPNL